MAKESIPRENRPSTLTVLMRVCAAITVFMIAPSLGIAQNIQDAQDAQDAQNDQNDQNNQSTQDSALSSPLNETKTLTIPDDTTASGFIVLSYHRFDRSEYPTSSISAANFLSHIKFLAQRDYNILPLTRALTLLGNDRPIPKNSVVITIDDGFRSFKDVALPIIQQYDIPVTLFISTHNHTATGPDYLEWQELKDLSKNRLITIGLSGSRHVDLTTLDEKTLLSELSQAKRKYQEQLGKGNPSVLAYPYGRTSKTVMNIIKKAGFNLAFGQHSSVVSKHSDPMFMGRFSMSDSLFKKNNAIERLQLVSSALPLVVFDLTPQYPDINDQISDISFRMWLPTISWNEQNLNCFINGQRAYTQITTPASSTSMPQSFSTTENKNNFPQVNITLPKSEDQDQVRINCTYPSTLSNQTTTRYHWFGTSFFINS